MSKTLFFRWPDLGVLDWYEITPELRRTAWMVWNQVRDANPDWDQETYADWAETTLSAWIWSGRDPDSTWELYALVRDLCRADLEGIMPETWDPDELS